MGAVKHRKIIEAALFGAPKAHYCLSNAVCFIPFVGYKTEFNRSTAELIGAKSFLLSALIVYYYLIGAIKYLFGRTIVLLKPYHLCAGKILFEIENIAYVRAAPAVDALVIITDHADISVLGTQELYYPILRSVCVLIFIHKNILKLAPVLLKNIGTC